MQPAPRCASGRPHYAGVIRKHQMVLPEMKQRTSTEWMGLRPELEQQVNYGRNVTEIAAIFQTSPMIMSAVLRGLGLEVLPSKIASELRKLRGEQSNVY